MSNLRTVMSKSSASVAMVQEWVLCFIVSTTVVVGLMQVVSRFVFRASLPWSEEVLRMSFIWMTFIGASLGMARNTHISMDVFIKMLPHSLNFAARVSVKVICIVFVMAISRLAFTFAMNSYRLGQRSTAMEIPMLIPYSALLIGFLCMILHLLSLLIDIIGDFRNNQATQ